MKINQWTLGLAAVGVVSLASVAQADEKTTPLLTALTSTTLSGYVDTSVNWQAGNNTVLPGHFNDNASKQDGFNLNVVSLSLDKPLDEGSWSAGYHVQALFGPDASLLGNQSFIGGQAGDFALNEAYVALRAPVGNGLDFKIGQFVSPLGYESFDSYKNPNYSRSYGYMLEPHSHVGVTASYVFTDWLSALVGVANSVSSPIDSRESADWAKTYMALVTLTAPESFGPIKGATLSGGFSTGKKDFTVAADDESVRNFYVGATLPTPITGLTVGAAFDRQEKADPASDTHASAFGLYTSFQASEKLRLNLRGEYARGTAGSFGNYYATDDAAGTFTGVSAFPDKTRVIGLTGTVDYSLWANVVTRAELRWDHSVNGARPFGDDKNALTAALNVIYKF